MRVVVFALLGVFLSHCSTSNSQTDQELLAPKEFAELAVNTEDAVLLDVRTLGEFEGGHIEGAVNVDWTGSEFAEGIAEIDKSTPLFVYCLSGGRSSAAVKYLKENGYTSVKELDGGMMAWRKASMPETTETEIKGAEMSTADFQALIESDKYVLVDFHAEWCAPCKKLKPILDEIASEYSDKVVIVRIDVDQNPTISNQLNVNGIPDLKLYKDRKLVWETKGLVEKSVITEQLK